jgi:hypothetical protein
MSILWTPTFFTPPTRPVIAKRFHYTSNKTDEGLVHFIQAPVLITSATNGEYNQSLPFVRIYTDASKSVNAPSAGISAAIMNQSFYTGSRPNATTVIMKGYTGYLPYIHDPIMTVQQLEAYAIYDALKHWQKIMPSAHDPVNIEIYSDCLWMLEKIPSANDDDPIIIFELKELISSFRNSIINLYWLKGHQSIENITTESFEERIAMHHIGCNNYTDHFAKAARSLRNKELTIQNR